MKLLKNILLCVTLGFSLIACTQNGSKSADSKDELTFAVSGEFRPFSYVDDSGDLVGFDVEVGKAVAAELGRTPKVVRYKFSGIIEGVKSGRFDIAVSSHTVTDERKEHVLFSKPYYYSGAQVFVREENLESIKGKEIAVSKGSTYSKMAKEFSSNIKVYDSDITALRALANGRHDAVITDFITGQIAIKEGLKLYPHKLLDRSEQAIALAKENAELQMKINGALDSLQEKGVLKKLSMKYFNRDISTL